jgi:hypothetical protein
MDQIIDKIPYEFRQQLLFAVHGHLLRGHDEVKKMQRNINEM